MTERSSGHQRRIGTRLFAATVVLTAIGVGLRGLSSPRFAVVKASEERSPKAQRLPSDLIGVSGARCAPLDGLAPGSQEAQERQREAVRELGLPLEVRTRKTGVVFRLIPPGSFTMGSPLSESQRFNGEVQHPVTLTKAFYCGKFEVTQGQWEQVMGSNPSRFKNAGKNAPVENVSRDDCKAFIEKLCQMEGVPGRTYRFLTEAEWEYACRAGTQTALYSGEIDILGVNNAPALDPIAWYTGNSGVDYEGACDSSGWLEKQYDHKRAGTHPVGGKRPNGFGLYDMIGNVWTWCQDLFGDYPRSTVTDPSGPRAGMLDVFRGGGWDDIPRGCRSAVRGAHPANPGGVGLRLARTLASRS